MQPHLLGDDSPLANLWEDICIQEQQEERSIFWDQTYEASLLGFLEGEVDDLDETTRWAIWHQTDAASGLKELPCLSGSAALTVYPQIANLIRPQKLSNKKTFSR